VINNYTILWLTSLDSFKFSHKTKHCLLSSIVIQISYILIFITNCHWYVLSFFHYSYPSFKHERSCRAVFIIGFHLAYDVLSVSPIVCSMFEIMYSLIYFMFLRPEIWFHPFLLVTWWHDRTYATLYADVTQKSITQNCERKTQGIPKTAASTCWYSTEHLSITRVDMEMGQMS